jgi:chromatin assembly factor 1 subunit B
MKSKTIQVVWHGKEPVYSLDFHPNGLLATAGADREIKTWRVSNDATGYPQVEHVDTLAGHSKTVNCVRFSPDGQKIVSAADGGELMLWVATSPDEKAGPQGNLVTEEEASAGYKRQGVMRGHVDDVMDLAWSHDGSAVVSGSIDNQSIVWSPDTTKAQKKFESHKHFVQGVAWDPHGQYFLTISADRMCKVHALKPKRNKAEAVDGSGGRRKSTLERMGEFHCADSICKRVVGSNSGDPSGTKRVYLLHDETLPSFFRRLSWSPDGSFVMIPSGVYKEDAESQEMHTAYLYARGKWASPIAHIPGQTKPVVAVRFCPVVFEREAKDEGMDGWDEADPAGRAEESTTPAPYENLPYVMVYAVATLDSVIIYDTASSLPLAAFCQLHYDSISDMAWSKDGKYLAVSSRDCFCSIISFDDGDLGKPAAFETLPQVVQDVVRKADVAPLKVLSKALSKDVTVSSVANANGMASIDLTVARENENKNRPVIRQEAVVKRKRIVPTPVGGTGALPSKEILNEALVASVPAPPVSSQMASEPSDLAKKKRITPQPVTNIASLAAIMGQAEAQNN